MVLFVYNRPEHTRKCLRALADNHLSEDSDLIVYSDGAKQESDLSQVMAVREVIQDIEGFRTVRKIFRDENRGLSKSIIEGVTETLRDHESVIILEDDLVTSPYFLKYMNDGIRLYQDHQKVVSIHGYSYPVAGALPETFFLKGADCWGWATWKSAWNCFREDGSQLMEELQRRTLINRFDFNNSYSFTRMLKNQIAGKTDSWAIRWYASALLANKFTLYPGQSLVQNIGMDGSGTHSETERNFSSELAQRPVDVQLIEIREMATEYQLFCDYFRSTQPGVLRQILKSLRNSISRLTRQ